MLVHVLRDCTLHDPIISDDQTGIDQLMYVRYKIIDILLQHITCFFD
jgi:hypothetical protein